MDTITECRLHITHVLKLKVMKIITIGFIMTHTPDMRIIPCGITLSANEANYDHLRKIHRRFSYGDYDMRYDPIENKLQIIHNESNVVSECLIPEKWQKPMKQLELNSLCHFTFTTVNKICKKYIPRTIFYDKTQIKNQGREVIHRRIAHFEFI